MQQGERVEALFVVASGECTVHVQEASADEERKVRTSEREAVVGRVGPGDVFGESLFLDDGRATATLVAASSSVTLKSIPTAQVNVLFARYEGFPAKFFTFLGDQLSQRYYRRYAAAHGIVLSETERL